MVGAEWPRGSEVGFLFGLAIRGERSEGKELEDEKTDNGIGVRIKGR